MNSTQLYISLILCMCFTSSAMDRQGRPLYRVLASGTPVPDPLFISEKRTENLRLIKEVGSLESKAKWEAIIALLLGLNAASDVALELYWGTTTQSINNVTTTGVSNSALIASTNATFMLNLSGTLVAAGLAFADQREHRKTQERFSSLIAQLNTLSQEPASSIAQEPQQSVVAQTNRLRVNTRERQDNITLVSSLGYYKTGIPLLAILALMGGLNFAKNMVFHHFWGNNPLYNGHTPPDQTLQNNTTRTDPFTTLGYMEAGASVINLGAILSAGAGTVLYWNKAKTAQKEYTKLLERLDHLAADDSQSIN